MIEWYEQKDVVIIGSGLPGLSAAIEANQAGASVIVLEKMKVTGGNTHISDGGIAAPNNFLQKRQGIEDSPDLFYEDMLRGWIGSESSGIGKSRGREGDRSNRLDAGHFGRELSGSIGPFRGSSKRSS